MVATGKAKDRVYIGKKFQETCDLPDLIGIQKESYENFLQGEKIKAGVEPASGQGLQEVFESTFPIASQNNEMILNFKSYNLDFNNIKFNQSECKKEGRTFSVPLKATVYLELSETGEIREKEIFLGDLPLMTERGTFIINGAERVVVSQIHRSPGVIFAREKGVLSSRIIPYRGSWLEFEIDEKKKIIVTKIDRKKKILGTLFLRAIGYDSREKILAQFYKGEEIAVSKKNKDRLAGIRLRKDVEIPGAKPPIHLRAGDPLGAAEIDALIDAGVPSVEAMVFGGKKHLLSSKSKDKPIGLRLYKDVRATVGGETRKIASAGDLIERRPKKAPDQTQPRTPRPGSVYIEDLIKAQVGTIYVNDLATPRDDVILHCFEIEEAKFTDQEAGEREPSKETVLTRIFSVLMSGEMVSVERAERELPEMFFSTRRYDLGAVGRYKLNKKFSNGEEPERASSNPEAPVLAEAAGGAGAAAGGEASGATQGTAGAVSEGAVGAADMAGAAEGAEAGGAASQGAGNAGAAAEGAAGGQSAARPAAMPGEAGGSVLRPDDIVNTMRYLIRVYGGQEKLDDIDHLGNRRVRSVGELLQQQLKVAFTKMERIARERMNQETDISVKPQDLIANKPIVATIKEFFGSSQFSQFMDQINPLAELTHKRRLTALGSGGLNRDRAGFEVRDVHYTHYGRMCPIETPEGPNIGLIVSLANYTKVNKYGFLETPYRKVVDGRVTDEVVYLDANDEERYHIAQASAELKPDGAFVNKDVPCRLKGDYMTVAPEEVSYMDVSPKQVISVAASLIPFLEHDDANRALMGSNMQRQAVPLVFPEAPRVGTGMEGKTAYDSGVLVKADRRPGTVAYVSAERIEVAPDAPPIELLPSEKGTASIRFKALEAGSTQIKAELKTGKTTISAFITVKVKEHVDPKEVTSISVKPQYIELNKDDEGAMELPLATVSFNGGPDAERLKKELTEWKADSSLTGVIDARHLRPTKEMKSRLKEMLDKKFDENLRMIRPDRRSGEGFVTVCAADKATVFAKIFVKVSAGAAGKRIPRLLPNTSELTIEKGAEGEVGVQVVGVDSPAVAWSVVDTYAIEKFQRTNQDTCFNHKPIVGVGEHVDKGSILADGSATDGGELALGRNILVGFVPWDGYNYEDAVLISERVVKEDIYTSIHIRELSTDVRETKLGSEKLTRDIPSISDKKTENLDEDGIVNIGTMVRPGHILIGKISPKNESDTTPEFRLLNSIFGEKAKDVRDVSLKVPHGTEGVVIDVQRFRRDSGDDLPPGVEETIKVLIATKRKLRQGDKMAGRHGNKGVVSRILPEEDMPFMADGTPLDVCLNPMGVPSRMNIGQLMETQLGWAAVKLDQWYTSPVFQSANQKQIEAKMAEAGLPKDSKTVLYDGRTGLPFVNPVFCGYIYYLKLHHLVDDKMHARSTGPYSLVTQQPLGGKAQFGGQRLGEMEVWALEAYGAANTLHELLTIKSDDMDGRNNVYNSIVKGNAPTSFGIPEAFNVLVQEIRGLALDMSVYDYKGKQVPLTERDEELINKKANQTSRS